MLYSQLLQGRRTLPATNRRLRSDLAGGLETECGDEPPPRGGSLYTLYYVASSASRDYIMGDDPRRNGIRTPEFVQKKVKEGQLDRECLGLSYNEALLEFHVLNYIALSSDPETVCYFGNLLEKSRVGTGISAEPVVYTLGWETRPYSKLITPAQFSEPLPSIEDGIEGIIFHKGHISRSVIQDAPVPLEEFRKMHALR